MNDLALDGRSRAFAARDALRLRLVFLLEDGQGLAAGVGRVSSAASRRGAAVGLRRMSWCGAGTPRLMNLWRYSRTRPWRGGGSTPPREKCHGARTPGRRDIPAENLASLRSRRNTLMETPCTGARMSMIISCLSRQLGLRPVLGGMGRTSRASGHPTPVLLFVGFLLRFLLGTPITCRNCGTAMACADELVAVNASLSCAAFRAACSSSHCALTLAASSVARR